MKILFVSSGNVKDGISPIVRNQGQSLIDKGIIVDYFTIKGKGILSYIRHIFILRKYLKTNKFDLVHSHYSYTSYVASLAGANPLIASLMGSDVISHRYSKKLILFFHQYFWTLGIVKSLEMYKYIEVKRLELIPNGVNMEQIHYMDKNECQNKLGWDVKKGHILFAANPKRKEKNFTLAKKAIKLLQYRYEIVMHILNEVPYGEIPVYLNASDVIVLCSRHEGSPNVIKEAMACNCPIVTTNVGDVKWVLGKTEGCYITSFKPEDVAIKIKFAIEFSEKYGQTKGRERIIELGLDSETVAKKIIEVYEKVVDNKIKEFGS